MKVAFYVVALLVASGAAYFSFELSRKLEIQIGERTVATDTNKTVTASAEATETTLASEVAALEAAQSAKAVVDQSIVALGSTQRTQKLELGELEGELEEQKVSFDQAEKALEEVNNIVEGLGADVTIDNLGEKVAEIEETRKANRAKLEGLEKLVGDAEERLASNRTEAGRMTDRRVERNARISRNAMEAVVTGVDNEWGFVVIGAGSNSGFTPQTSLLVRRDGRLIGRVQPSAIEPNQTIADIIPASMVDGVRIQKGDRVILAKPAN